MANFARKAAEHFQKTGKTLVCCVQEIVLGDPALLKVFRTFLKTNYADENLEFFEECLRGQNDFDELATRYIVPGAPRQVNIPAETGAEILRLLGRKQEAGVAGHKALRSLQTDALVIEDDDDDDDDDDTVVPVELPVAGKLSNAIAEACREIQTLIDRNFMTRFQQDPSYYAYCSETFGDCEALAAEMNIPLGPVDPAEYGDPNDPATQAAIAQQNEIFSENRALVTTLHGQLTVGTLKEGMPEEELDELLGKVLERQAGAHPLSAGAFLSKAKARSAEISRAAFETADAAEAKRTAQLRSMDRFDRDLFVRTQTALNRAWRSGDTTRAHRLAGQMADYAGAFGKTWSARASIQKAVESAQNAREYEHGPPPDPDTADQDEDVPPPPPSEDDLGIPPEDRELHVEDLPPPPSSPPPTPFFIPPGPVYQRVTAAIQTCMKSGDHEQARSIADQMLENMRLKGLAHSSVTRADILTFAWEALSASDPTGEVEFGPLKKNVLTTFKWARFQKLYRFAGVAPHKKELEQRLTEFVRKLIKKQGTPRVMIADAKAVLAWMKDCKIDSTLTDAKHLIAALHTALTEWQNDGNAKTIVKKKQAMEWFGE